MNRLEKHTVLQFYLICFLGLLCEWLPFTFSAAWTGGNNFVTVAKGIGDCMMLLISFWFIHDRYKGWILTILWAISIFFLCNLWYFRFWGNLIPITFYRLSGNVNADLLNSVRALIKAYDCLFIIIPAAVTIYYFCYARKRILKEAKTSKKIKYGGIILSIATFVLAQGAYTVTSLKWSKSAGIGDTTFMGATVARLSVENPASLHDFSYNGLSIYGIQSIIGVIKDLTEKKSIILNDNDITSIRNFLNSVPQFDTIPELAGNRDKNLIIILVESLNADVIGKTIEGNEITPFLNSMLDSAGTVSALNIIPQVMMGCSNDGQLLTNTGLLPLKHGVSSMEFGEGNTYPNLPQILNRPEATAIFGDTGYTWNQIEAYRSYGFKTIFTLNDYKSQSDKLGRDKAMFNFSEKIIENLKQPFLLELLTFSMHVPFKESSVPLKDWLATAELPINEKNYLNMTRYFDDSLKGFVDFLKSKNLYDDTVIVIVSDHSQGLATGDTDFDEGNNDLQDAMPMLFMALNTGFTYKKPDISGQVNVFPTILQIMGQTGESYRGMDRSLLDPELKSAVTTQGEILGSPDEKDSARQLRAFNVTDSLQRGDFFRHIN